MKKLVKNSQTLGMGKRKRYGEVKRLWEVKKHVDYDSFMREKKFEFFFKKKKPGHAWPCLVACFAV